jgi:hypothetical protein
MSEQPQGQNEDTKYTKNNSKDNIEQPEQVGKQDTAERESVESGRGSTTRGGKASGGTAGL